MKRFFILLVVALIASTGLYAEESVLIDFSTLTADYPSANPDQNTATMIDFSTVAGASYSAAEKAQMKTSLFEDNWDVVLNTSARTVDNQSLSYTRAAKVSANATKYANATVLGIRVHFPEAPYNAWAIVEPPFEIPAYADATVLNGDTLSTPQNQAGKGTKFDNYGVVKNVGTLKSILVNIHGLNYPEGFSIILKDQNNVQQEYFMGYLNFDGWKTIQWDNPNYVKEVRNRELHQYPLYPNSTPMLKLIGFRIYKDAAQDGGDFITYIKDVHLIYDKAVLSLQSDIDDEAVWGILQQRESNRRNSEMKRLGQEQVLRYLEKQKMDNPAADASANGGSSSTSNANGGTANSGATNNTSGGNAANSTGK